VGRPQSAWYLNEMLNFVLKTHFVTSKVEVLYFCDTQIAESLFRNVHGLHRGVHPRRGAGPHDVDDLVDARLPDDSASCEPRFTWSDGQPYGSSAAMTPTCDLGHGCV
jgi:hypothetical protein